MIQSVFDLCLDIQEKIGDELKPLVKAKLLQKKCIYECSEKMKQGGFLIMEDHVFRRNIRHVPRTQIPHQFVNDTYMNIGRLFLKIETLKKKFPHMFSEPRSGVWATYNELMGHVISGYSFELNQNCTIIARNKLDMIDKIVDYDTINLFGLQMIPTKYEGRYVLELKGYPVIISSTQTQYSKITHFVLDSIGKEQEYKNWRTSWTKQRKISRLIHDDP